MLIFLELRITFIMVNFSHEVGGTWDCVRGYDDALGVLGNCRRAQIRHWRALFGPAHGRHISLPMNVSAEPGK